MDHKNSQQVYVQALPDQLKQVFLNLSLNAIEPLRKLYPFYEWDAQTHEQRWMCSFDTTPEEIDEFVLKLKELI